MKRRQFLNLSAMLPAASIVPVNMAPIDIASIKSTQPADLHLSCNLYTWYSYYNREGKNFYADLDAGLAQVAASGMNGFEPSLTSTEQIDQMVPLMEKHGLEMRSIYVNSKLHEAAESAQSIDSVLKIVERCAPLGTKIVVTNPSPIGWGSGEDKSDAQLLHQAESLEKLGAEIHRMGMTLAYHTHDSEFRAGAREFHHMMQRTDPRHVTFCLDVHWVYRGALNSNVALFDAIKMYGDRISELHIRQSKNQIWTETFGAGDIDYTEVVRVLNEMNLRPMLVLEQAAEEGTPLTMSALDAHRRSQVAVRQIFAPLS